MTAGRPAVFLDRDGVLNDVVLRGDTVSSPRNLAELSLVEEAPAATARLAEAGFTLVVVTNQPDLSRGLLAEGELAAIHAELSSVHPLAGFYVCPHERRAGCECRKPAPGLLVRAAAELGLELDAASWAIGDRWADIAAGRAAGVSTALLSRPWSWDPVGGVTAPPGLLPDLVETSLKGIVDAILDRHGARI